MPVDTLLDALKAEETLVFVHRGASAWAPQNTFAAFELAAQQGAQGIELDVHLTRDGHLAVIHDAIVDATTDGQGAVAEMSLAQLKELDAGAWFSPEFAGERIPTLDEVFAEFGDRLLINVEVKAGRESLPALEKRLADCVRKHKLRERIIVSCFDPVVLRRVKEMMPMVMAGFLSQPDMPAEHYLPLKKLWHEARHPRQDMVDKYYMNWARAQGKYVNVWTVNDPARACELKSLGVDCIITDQPAAILAALRLC